MWLKKCLVKKFLFKIIFGSKEDCSKTNVGPQILSHKKLGPLEFGQNWTSNSLDNPNMGNKCRQDKYCLDKCHFVSWNQF